MLTILKIAPNENGSHDDVTYINTTPLVPDGWAVLPASVGIPDTLENFPFGNITVDDSTPPLVTSWTPVAVPVPPAPSPAEQRENAYNTLKIVEWNGDTITVTEAAQLWNYYAAEGSDKANQLQVLIAEAKQIIREKYPD